MEYGSKFSIFELAAARVTASLVSLAMITVLVPSLGWATDEAADEPLAGYHKGFFIRSDDGDFELRTRARVQTRLTFECEDTGVEDESCEQGAAFSIARARLKLQGHAFGDELSYTFQADFGKGFVALKDFYIDWEVADGIQVRMGQWKRPFSRQQLTSSSRLELVDRAITDKAFGAGRDIGVMIHNGYTSSPHFEWALGVFNGTGDKPWLTGDVLVDPTTGEGEIEGGKFTNVPSLFEPALVLRVGFNTGDGNKGYSEGDLEYDPGDDLRFSAGASVHMDLDATGENGMGTRAELDYSLKAAGFATTGAFFMAMGEDENGDAGIQSTGFHAQASYMITDTIQPAVRYARIMPDGGESDSQEITAGLSVYIEGHSLKWQTDASMLTQDVGDTNLTDIRARSQIQLSF